MDDLGNTTLSLGREFNRAVANEFVPHIFHLTTMWMIPSPRVQGFAGKLLQGWELNSLTTWQSGFPFSIVSGVDNSLSSVGGDRADFIGTDLDQAKLSGLSHAQMVDRYFNTSLFTVNAIGTFGSAGRNILPGPGFFNTDLGVIKNTNVTEQIKVQFRAEFFNLFNKTNLGAPSANVLAGNFGTITSLSSPARQIQFALKLLF
jgi:hypothetical protein